MTLDVRSEGLNRWAGVSNIIHRNNSSTRQRNKIKSVGWERQESVQKA